MWPTRPIRAQASGFIVFFLILGVAALVWGLTDPAMTRIFATTSNATTNQAAEDTITQSQTIWNNILFFAVLFAMVFLVARAIFQSRRG